MYLFHINKFLTSQTIFQNLCIGSNATRGRPTFSRFNFYHRNFQVAETQGLAALNKVRYFTRSWANATHTLRIYLYKIILNVSPSFSSCFPKLLHFVWFSHQNSLGLYVSSSSNVFACPFPLIITTLEAMCDLYKSSGSHKTVYVSGTSSDKQLQCFMSTAASAQFTHRKQHSTLLTPTSQWSWLPRQRERATY